MKETVNRLHTKVDKIDDKLDNIDTHLAVYNEQLRIHIKRTELIENDLAPIKSHVNQMNGAMKLVSILSVVISIVAAIYKTYGE